MSTKQQTTEQTIPAGFTHRTEEDDCIPGVYYDTWDGPRAGGVQAHWSPERGITLAVDGYDTADGMSGPLGFDVTPAVAPMLAADLTAVLEEVQRAAVDARQDVRDAARRLAGNRRATITDVIREADRLGVRTSELARVMEQVAKDDA